MHWQAGSLVDAVASQRPLPSSLREQLVERADGVPLFLEELTRAVLASDALRGTGATPLEIPSTLRGLLTARLDALGTAKGLLQVASVLGRTFPRDLLEAVTDGSGIDAALRVGVSSGLIRAGSERDEEVFEFGHALIQEAAYDSQLREKRRAVHERVARILLERFPERAREEPEVVARHFEDAGLWREAIQHYRHAGRESVARSAHREALQHLSRALELVPRIPDAPERAKLELGLLVAIGPSVSAVKGFGHAEIESTQRRAYELSQEVGAGPDLYQAYGALYLFYGPRAELDTGTSLATGLIELGQRQREPFVEGMGEGFLGLMEFYRGRFEAARMRSHRMLALEGRVGVPDWYAYDMQPDVIARYCGANALALLGRLDEARAMGAEMIERGARGARAFNRGFALVFAGLAFHACGDAERVGECAEHALAVCRDHGFTIIEGLATALAGWKLARSGDASRGVAQVQAGLVIGSAARALIEGPRVLGLLAEARLAAGDWPGAQEALRGGIAIAERLGNRFWNAELERLTGELMLLRDASAREEGAGWLRRAIARAQEQGSVLLANRVRETAARYRIESLTEEP
jgi:tetratricopeptide (TPR) repeat protein